MMALVVLTATTGVSYHVYCGSCTFESPENTACCADHESEESCCSTSTASEYHSDKDAHISSTCKDEFVSVDQPFVICNYQINLQFVGIITSIIPHFFSELFKTEQTQTEFVCNNTSNTYNREILSRFCVLLI